MTIYRDEYGVPHIVGETEEATFFGYGYAQAQDHLETMMSHYLDAQGRLAEIRGFDALGQGYFHYVGPPDSDEYRWDGDYLQRLLRTKKGVVENKVKINPQTYLVLRGFARGVNAYIAEHRGKIPRWIEPITPEDVEAEERSHYFRFYSVNEALIKLTNLPRVFPNSGFRPVCHCTTKIDEWARDPLRRNTHALGQSLSELRSSPHHSRQA